MIRVGDMVTFRPGALSWNKRDHSAVYPVIGVESPNGDDVMIHLLGPGGDVFWEWQATVEVASRADEDVPRYAIRSCGARKREPLQRE